MKKLIALGAVVLLMGLALAAAAMPLGQGDAQVGTLPGERAIEVQGAAVSFGGTLEEPGITTYDDSITVEGASSTFSAPLQEP